MIQQMTNDTAGDDDTTGDDDTAGDDDSDSTIETCGEVTITYGNGQINIEGESGKEYYFKVLPRFGKWSPVLNCVRGCGNVVELKGLLSGKYSIDVWSNSWQKVCSTIIELNAGSSTDTSDDDATDTSDDATDTSDDDATRWLN